MVRFPLKNLFVCLIAILLINCKAQKIEKEAKETKIQEIFDRKDVIVNYPTTWKYYLDHNSISYSPKDLKDEFYKCRVNIFRYNESILSIWPINQGIKTKEDLQKASMPKTIQTRFGTTDIYKVTNVTEYMTSNHEVTTLIFHFSHKENFYVLRYRAFKEYFDEYKEDLDYFMANLNFRNE